MKKIQYLNKLYLTLGCGIALMSSLLSNEVYAATYYDSISNGYYKLYGNFWWEGSSSKTERDTSWYSTPPTPNDVYKPNAVEIGSRTSLGYEVENIQWYSPSSAPTPKARPGRWSYEKRCYVNYRRALTTPQTGSISVGNAYRASNSLYWVKENASAHVTYAATQDFNGTDKGFEDYITKNYITFAVNGGKVNNPYITNDRWVYSIAHYNNNSLLSVSFKGMNADNAKGDTNRTMHSSVYVSLKNNGTEVELGGRADSANGKSSALSWSGIKIKCDAKNPTANISTSYSSSNAIVKISASDGESGLSSIQYKLSGAQNKDWTSISNNGSISITALGNTTVYVRATDNVGNTYETSKTVTTDTIAPTISHTISPTGWTKGNVTINIKASDAHSGLKNIMLPNNSITTSSTASYAVGSNGTYTFKATDNAGNVNTYNVNITNIDKTAPVISLSQNPTAWTKGNVSVNATITENQSGINIRKWAAGNQSIGYFANGGTTITSNSFTATANGTYTFYVKDNAGNESIKTINITNIDKVAPIISLSQNPTGWTKGNVNVTAFISETGSGVYTRKWAVGNQSVSYFANGGTSVTSNGFTATSNGTYTFYVKDNAGNESIKTIKVANIDNTAPVITLSHNPTAWTKGNVTVNANITETQSGINIRKWAAGNQSIGYFANGGTTITSNSFTATANGSYTFYTKDNVGNESIKTINITNIDKVAPIITLSQNPTGWTKGDVNVTAFISETGSGVHTRKWAVGNQSVNYFANGGTSINSNGFTATSNGTYTFYVKDNAGNETVKVITISNIDKTAPVITLSQNPTAWTNGNVTVTANITETQSGINIRKWATGNQNASYFATNGTTIATNNFTATANGTYTLYVKDNAGNESIRTINITNIDKVAPVITLSQNPTAWTKGNVTVNAAITETGSGVNIRKWSAGNQSASYFANGGTTITSNSFTATANGTYTFYVKDNAGNETVKAITISNIDKTAPVITLTQNPTAWTNGNVTVTANITETQSGIHTRKWAAGNQSIGYFANGGTTITTNSFVATTNGVYTFYTKDNVGNESIRTINITNIDKIAPVITLTQNPTAWTNGNVTVNATITETGSGVNTRKWAAGSQSASYFANGGTTITTNSFTATANGTYTFYVKDNAGNVTIKTINITNIDKVAPVITLSQNPTAWTNGNVTVNATITETGSGIHTRKWAAGNQNASYFANNGTTITTNSFVATANGTYTFYVKDNAGNVTVKAITISNIDKTAPVITLTQNPTAWTKGNVTVNAAITETQSGIHTRKWAAGNQNASYFANNGTTITTSSFTVTTNGTYTFYTKDNVGNETVKAITISNIDKTAPVITLTQNPTVWTNGNVTVTAAITETQSGIHTRKWAAGNQSIGYFANGGTTITTNSFVATTNGIYTFYAKDNVGNESIRTINITNIDKVAPVITLSQNPTTWTKGNVTVNAAITETQSGIHTRKWAAGNQNASYFANNGTTITTSSFTVTTNGTYTFYTKDNVGNETVKAITISNIDKTAPVITLTQNPTVWTNGNVTVTAAITETQSGIHTRKWAAGSQSIGYFANGGTTITTNSFVATTNGIYTFYAKDNVGNESIRTINITNIDKIAPVITLSQNPTAWTNGNVTVTANITETGSGVNTRKWAAGNQNASYFATNGTTITTNSFVANANGTYTFYVKDNAGNVTVKTITISNIDKIAPVITLTQNPTVWTNGNVTVNATITETGSGVHTKKWAAGSQSASYFAHGGTTITTNSFTATANGTYTFYVKDNAGNITIKTINITNIDRILPTITGTLDYPWIKGTRTVSFTSTDNESGINSLRLWNNNKTKVLKEGSVNNKSASLSHVITEEGITRYKIEAIDNATNVTIKDIVVRIDNTSPEGIISMPNITNTKTIEILFSNLVDTYSGLKEAIVAENSSFSGANIVKLSLSDVTSIDDVKSTKFTLSAKSTIEEHFSERKVYVRLVDNVGNYKDYTFSVSLVPKKPNVPEIVSPKEDQLYVTDEIVNLSWTYNSIDEDLGYLPQHKAEIELTHLETGTTTIVTVEGEVFNNELQTLENGEYEVKVKVYNFETIYEESEVRRFRFNKFKDTGNVLTIDITPGSPIRYISVVTKAAVPSGTTITGKVYYSKKSTGAIDKTQYVDFEITNVHSNNNIIKLPIDTGDVRVEYFLKGVKGDKLISPILDHIVIYGK